MLKEFRDFIARGNVMDLAVGIIIGAAFTAIVSSLVSDLINPVIGLILGGIDFTNMYWVMSGKVPAGAGLQTARDSGAAIFAYGSFITAVINFMIIAWVVFLLVKAVNALRDRADVLTHKQKDDAIVAAAAAGPTEVELLTQIRDALVPRA